MPAADEDGERRQAAAPKDEPSSSASDWDARRRVLSDRLERHAARSAAERDGMRAPGRYEGVAQGLRLASEFVAGVLVGAGIGYLLDRFAGTSPFGLIFFLLVGFAAGVVNMLRAMSGHSGGTGPTGR